MGDWSQLGRGPRSGLSDHLLLWVDVAVRPQLVPVLLRSRLQRDGYAYALALVQRSLTALDTRHADRLCQLIQGSLGDQKAIALTKLTLTDEIARAGATVSWRLLR